MLQSSTSDCLPTDVPLGAPGSQAKDSLSNAKKPTKAKILHVINGEHYSGAERVQDLLGNRLPDYGYEVGFACVKPGQFEESRSFDRSPVWNTEMKSRFDLKAARKIEQIVKEYGFELIHAHTPRSALVGGIAAKRCRIPFVFHVHSPTSRDSTRWLINWINQKIERWSIRKADRIVTVSDSLKTHMESLGIDPRKIVVCPNGVPVQEKIQLPSSENKFVVGTVALFRPRKGTEILLQAISQLKKRGVNVHCLAVGPFENPTYEKQLFDLVDELQIGDCIEWTGFTQDVASHFKKMNAFALPSLFGEGLPMVVLEAMSYGVPVVASDVEGIPQAIRSEKDGLIVKAGDPHDLANRIQELADSDTLCETLSDNAFLRQQEKFSDMSMARDLSHVYDDILLANE